MKGQSALEFFMYFSAFLLFLSLFLGWISLTSQTSGQLISSKRAESLVSAIAEPLILFKGETATACITAPQSLSGRNYTLVFSKDGTISVELSDGSRVSTNTTLSFLNNDPNSNSLSIAVNSFGKLILNISGTNYGVSFKEGGVC